MFGKAFDREPDYQFRVLSLQTCSFLSRWPNPFFSRTSPALFYETCIVESRMSHNYRATPPSRSEGLWRFSENVKNYCESICEPPFHAFSEPAKVEVVSKIETFPFPDQFIDLLTH
jgi:hypothetical protein